MVRAIFLTFLVLLASCSTLDRRTYYSPSSTEGELHPPEKEYCGLVQFGKKADSITIDGLTYEANQTFEPYFWGPWLITVVPIFPATWAVDVFINPNLRLTIHKASDDAKLPVESQLVAKVIYKNGKELFLRPSSFDSGIYGVEAVFPMKSSAVESFVLHVGASDATVTEIQFHKVSRWSWSQWCIN